MSVPALVSARMLREVIARCEQRIGVTVLDGRRRCSRTQACPASNPRRGVTRSLARKRDFSDLRLRVIWYVLREATANGAGYTRCYRIYTLDMTKHLVDLDDDLLAEARAELGTSTIKDTVNEALRRSSEKRLEQIADSLDTLAAAHLEDREAAWR